jgi:hypothetical protein
MLNDPALLFEKLPYPLPHNITPTMQFFVAALLSLLCTVQAFTAFPGAKSSTALFAKSKALPFLEAPAKLDGSMVGDFGFDPLGFTNTLQSMNYARAAELKHGRVAMLACVGFLQPFHFLTAEADPLKATFALGYGPNLQILSFIGVIELATWDKTFKGDASGTDCQGRGHIIGI